MYMGLYIYVMTNYVSFKAWFTRGSGRMTQYHCVNMRVVVRYMLFTIHST